MGSPIRKSTDIADICSSPWLIAACHVLLRLLMPRHSPCALSSLTASSQALYRSSPRSRGASLAPLLLLFLANPFHWASLGEGDAGLRPCFDGLKRLFGSLRIMQAILQDLEIVIVTLHLSVRSTIKTSFFFRTIVRKTFCCLAYHFHSTLFSFQGAISDLKSD